MKDVLCINCGHHAVCMYYHKLREFLGTFYYGNVIAVSTWADRLAEHCRRYEESEEE